MVFRSGYDVGNSKGDLELEKHRLHGDIDQDSGLKSKRNFLVITSLIVLAVHFSGAKVVEANTFILNVSFAQQEGISLLLVLAVFLQLIRYHTYASPYHRRLFTAWSSELMNDKKVSFCCPFSDSLSGFANEVHPINFDPEGYRNRNNGEYLEYDITYECQAFLVRGFVYHWSDEHQDYAVSLNVLKSLGVIKYLALLRLEFRYQFGKYIDGRESLDILGPYFLGVFALLSFVFQKHLAAFVTWCSNL